MTGFDLTLDFLMLLEYRSVVELLEYYVKRNLAELTWHWLTSLFRVDHFMPIKVEFRDLNEDKNGMRNKRLTWDRETWPGSRPEKRVSLIGAQNRLFSIILEKCCWAHFPFVWHYIQAASEAKPQKHQQKWNDKRHKIQYPHNVCLILGWTSPCLCSCRIMSGWGNLRKFREITT